MFQADQAKLAEHSHKLLLHSLFSVFFLQILPNTSIWMDIPLPALLLQQTGTFLNFQTGSSVFMRDILHPLNHGVPQGSLLGPLFISSASSKTNHLKPKLFFPVLCMKRLNRNTVRRPFDNYKQHLCRNGSVRRILINKQWLMLKLLGTHTKTHPNEPL